MTTPFPTVTVDVTPTLARSLQLLYPEVRNPNENSDEFACDILLDFLRTGKAHNMALMNAMVRIARHFQWSGFMPLPCTAGSEPYQHLMRVWEQARRQPDVRGLDLANFNWRPFDIMSAARDMQVLDEADQQPRLGATLWLSPLEKAGLEAVAA